MLKYNLDKGKKYDSKKEEEEKHRRQLILQTFTNWLQTFAILASVIREDLPVHFFLLHGCTQGGSLGVWSLVLVR